MSWLGDLWWRLKFFFKPTYYVFSNPQEAFDLAAKRGGTIKFGVGEFTLTDKLLVPNQDIRVIGANFKLPVDAAGFSLPKDCKISFEKCIFTGDPGTPPHQRPSLFEMDDK